MPQKNKYSHNLAQTALKAGSAGLLVGIICACSTGPAPSAGLGGCAAIVGSYDNAAEEGNEQLFKALTGFEGQAGTVKIVYAAEQFSVVASKTTTVLIPVEDATCAPGGELMLSRQDVANIRLPPLLDQTVTTTYGFSNRGNGYLVRTTYSQTTLRPYGKEIKGPRRIDSTATWKRASI